MKKVSFREAIFQPVEKYTIKEELDPVSKKVTGIIIEGIALDTSKPSRNGVIYDHNSVLNSCEILNGKPMLLNHNDNKLPVGHVERVWMDGNLMKYRGNIDPEEKDLVRKIKRGDINNVSIQTLVEEVTHEEDLATGKQYTRAFPNDWAELSIVTIPGFADTTINMAEAFKGRKEDEEEEKTKKEDVNTSNADALLATALAKKIKPAVEPASIKQEKFESLEEALDVIKIINQIGGDK